MQLKIPKAFKFIISGGTAALSKLAFFFVLFSVFHVFYLLASAVAFALSVVVGFYLQKYFTFENLSKEDMGKQATIFIFVSFLNLLVNVAVMYLLVGVFKFNEIFSQILTIGIIACWNYFVYQKFVFNKSI